MTTLRLATPGDERGGFISITSLVEGVLAVLVGGVIKSEKVVKDFLT
jgi:hypothetical protein